MDNVVPKAGKEILVRAFYRFTFVDFPRVQELKDRLDEVAEQHSLGGSILLSSEGCNGTIAGLPSAIEAAFEVLRQVYPDLRGQDSWHSRIPFGRWKVLLKDQIVAARDKELSPNSNYDGQLDPESWDKACEMARRGEAQMIDVRNHYEVAIGTFPEAIDPGTATFKEFSDYLDREVGQSLDPEKPTAIFCTGGIRCEKARMDLERRGFQNILQLHGGILGYLKAKPKGGFQGECFVFDERVALDADLAPSQIYDRCPGCGDPWPRGESHNCRPKRTQATAVVSHKGGSR